MAALKDIKIKITGVKKTQQITKAMNMVAAAKLRGAQARMEDFRPYADKFRAVMGDLAGGASSNAFPLMAVREVRKVLLVLISSDRGLCGAFNTNLIHTAEKFLAAQEEQGREVALVCVGRKGAAYFGKSRFPVVSKTIDVMGNVQMFNARQVAQEVIRLFLEEAADEVHLLFSRFVNPAVQRPTVQRLLPITSEGLGEGGGEEGPAAAYTYEPEPERILNQLMPMYVNVQLMHAMLETAASEQGARMTAMDNATRACKDMIDSLSLVYNKARQAAITTELMDIVGGAEALKG
ncbi:ATP synthase F1 subunit gamma [Dissulfurirhabdus thermomarina]|uniref:ATP synthase gamma chain n=1 Tax=Dissulfurirhabdus thermomarina TaxID=1765737 RepID=A0A6N9TLH3_DISTH|nr:ATP synthase F1 subunit gamma [Dissulfurirhabdus thermomarina]NDY42075.1 ATP synthase F1 subunit gamma [Dissulfurirhabdus thermomarina]NMX22825.1 ATP synthase F1 subunit gamma [Dissulfurirhabdus thermomarina]